MYYKVFIDTNIYDGANYSFNNGAFTVLCTRASRGELERNIHSVVGGETKKHIKSEVKSRQRFIGCSKESEICWFSKLIRFSR